MKIETIIEEWEKDAKIDSCDLATESLNSPSLHHKYYKIYLGERALWHKMKADLIEFRHLKYEYFLGHLNNPQDLQELGWAPFEKKILKSEMDQYLDADKDIIERKLKISLQEEKLSFLESIIKTIGNRGFAIKNAIDFLRFTNGA